MRDLLDLSARRPVQRSHELSRFDELAESYGRSRTGANPELYGGWPMVLSGLKTLLETGETLTTPGSLLYLKA